MQKIHLTIFLIFFLPSSAIWAQLSDCYASSNWIKNTVNTSGYIIINETTITINPDADGTGTNLDMLDCSATDGMVTTCIIVPTTGDITFDWDASGVGSNALVDKFGYCINGVSTELTSTDPSPDGTFSGTTTITLTAGDELCFVSASKLADGMANQITLDNFILPECPPPPPVLIDCYASSNWTTNTANTSGSVSIDGNTITLTPDADGTGTNLDTIDCTATDGMVTTCIIAPASGGIKFDWNAGGVGSNALADKFGYCVNGVSTELTSNDPSPNGTFSGTKTIYLSPGDELCFVSASKLADGLASSVTIDNFNLPACPPPPPPPPPLVDCYASSNWIKNTVNTSGYIIINETTITINPDADGTGTNLDMLDCSAADGMVTTCIIVPTTGDITFGWDASGAGSNALVDKFGYCINGVSTELTSTDPSPDGTFSGTTTITLTAGDELCFVSASKLADGMANQITLDNFILPECPPPPPVLIDCYASSNWTTNTANTSGSVSIDGNTITLTPDADGTGTNLDTIDCTATDGMVTTCIIAPASGGIKFDWNAGGVGSNALTDKFGYCVNGVSTELTSNDPSPNGTFSGTKTIYLSPGDELCFVSASKLADGLASSVTIDNFNLPACPPPPPPPPPLVDCYASSNWIKNTVNTSGYIIINETTITINPDADGTGTNLDMLDCSAADGMVTTCIIVPTTGDITFGWDASGAGSNALVDKFGYCINGVSTELTSTDPSPDGTFSGTTTIPVTSGDELCFVSATKLADGMANQITLDNFILPECPPPPPVLIDCYASSNWTTNTANTSGSVSIDGNTITLTPDADGTGTNLDTIDCTATDGMVTTCIIAPASGGIKFDWNAGGVGSNALADKFGYCVNGVSTELTSNDPSPNGTFSGTKTIYLSPGDELCFVSASKLADGLASSVTIDNFNLPACPPPPPPPPPLVDCYASSNWIKNTVNTSGYIIINETTITINPDADGTGTNLDMLDCSAADGMVTTCIIVPTTGDITFGWDASGAGSNALVDKFGYCINGVSTELTSTDPSPDGTFSGTTTITLTAGDELCFVSASKLADGMANQITLDNFILPECPPPPPVLIDCYASSNWTTNTANTSGSVSIDGNTITLTPDADGTGTNLDTIDCTATDGMVTTCIIAPASGGIKFDWNAGGVGSNALTDKFGYCVNGVSTELTSNDPSPNGTFSGTKTIYLSPGDELCFVSASKLADGLASSVTIDNFNLPACPPPPPPPPPLVDCYASSNWIKNTVNTSGYIIINETTITINPDADGTGTNLDMLDCSAADGMVTTCIIVPTTGDITFGWDASGAGSNALVDKFGYCINGVSTELTSTDPSPDGTFSGTTTIPVTSGDELCFVSATKLADGMANQITLDNFILPECPPPPPVLVDCYASSNWTTNTANTSGSVSIDGNTITLTPDADGTGTNLDTIDCTATDGMVTTCIIAPASGGIKFDWNAGGVGSNALADKFGYCVNGVSTELTSNDPSPNGTFSGTKTIYLSPGDELCFVSASKLADGLASSVTIDNFNLPACPPPPPPPPPLVDCYASSNWIKNTVNTSGYIIINETTITINPDADGTGTNLDMLDCSAADGMVTTCIIVPTTGDITFGWDASGAGSNALVDKFGYCINGVSTELTSTDPSPDGTFSGTTTITLTAGDELCFVSASKLADGMANQITLDNFILPECPPPPPVLIDCYASSNWTTNTANTSGSVSIDGNTITLTPDADGTGTNLDTIDCTATDGMVTTCIIAPASGGIKFDWNAGGVGSNALADKFGYCVNGVSTELTSNDPSPNGTFSGTKTIYLSPGDELCFVSASKLADGLASSVTIDNFNLPACPPPPPPPPPLVDCYASSNWIKNTVNTSGYIIINETTITINPDADGTGTNLDMLDCSAADGMVTTCIIVPTTGDITFGWDASGAGSNALVDKFGYCINGVSTELTSTDPSPDGTFSGTTTIPVTSGDELCFVSATKLADGMANQITLDNFILPECPPPPPVLVDCYASSNWTTNTANTSGSVSIDGNTITLTPDADGTGTNLDTIDCTATDGMVTTCIIAPASGGIKFDWNAGGVGSNALADKFGYCVNGVSTELTSNDPSPNGTFSGTKTIYLSPGDELCFVSASKLADGLASSVTIDNFNLPACPPPPPPPPPLVDCYASSNWIKNTVNTSGYIIINETTITINPDADGTGTNLDMLDCSAADGMVTTCIIVPTTGDITFDWDVIGVGSNALVDKFGYCINGVSTELTSNDPSPDGTFSGTTTITATAGDELCFVSATKLADGMANQIKLDNFVLPECPPPPLLDCYASSNWTTNTANTSGSVSIDTTTITLNPDEDGTGTNLDILDCSATDGIVTTCIIIPTSGDITFDWDAGGFGTNALVEKFGYCLNGVSTELSTNSPPPFGTFSGTTTTPVSVGDELCFVSASKFANGFPSSITINNFVLPACVILPLSECYEASNWITTTTNTSGSVTIDETTIVINGDKDGTGTGLDVLDCSATDGNVTTCITIPAPGEISFDWSGQSDPMFNPLVEKFGYCLNGVAIELTSLDPPPLGTSSGSTTIIVSTGDELCFIYGSKWADNAIYSPYTLTNFEVTPCEEIFTASISAIPDTLACFGDTNGSILVTQYGGSPDYTYVWDNAAVSGNNPMNIGAGTYCVTVTDGQGETSTACIEIVEPSELTAIALIDSNVSCNGGTDGQATVTPTGGTTGYNYLWDNNETTATAISLVAGTHTVIVTDASGCETIASTGISEPDSLTILMSSTAELDMNANGTATATAGGGTSSYSYIWDTDPVQIAETATGLSAGTYNVTVTDTNGCGITGSVVVDQMTGIEGFSEITNFNIFPNPSSGKVYLEMDFNQSLDMSIRLFNSLGQELSKTSFKNMNSIRHSFDWVNLPKGIYWLSISSKDKRLVKKVVLH